MNTRVVRMKSKLSADIASAWKIWVPHQKHARHYVNPPKSMLCCFATPTDSTAFAYFHLAQSKFSTEFPRCRVGVIVKWTSSKGSVPTTPETEISSQLTMPFLSVTEDSRWTGKSCQCQMPDMHTPWKEVRSINDFLQFHRAEINSCCLQKKHCKLSPAETTHTVSIQCESWRQSFWIHKQAPYLGTHALEVRLMLNQTQPKHKPQHQTPHQTNQTKSK